MEGDEDDCMEEPSLSHPISEESAVSDQQLLHLLRDRKTSTQSPWQPTSSLGNQVLIKDVSSNEDLHPINILTVLGIDLRMTSQLEHCYYFFSYTRYHMNAARDRQTKKGLHTWLQGGGRNPVMDDKREESSQSAMIGWKKKFIFVTKSKRKKLRIKVGSDKYSFGLDELVLAEDEEEEEEKKRKLLARETLQSFLCAYRLYPTAHPCKKKDEIQEQVTESSQLCNLVEWKSPEVTESSQLYNPEEWKSPALIGIPWLEDRYDLQSMSPSNKS